MAAALTRRKFIRVGLCGSAVLLLPAGCGDAEGNGGATDSGRFLDEHQYETIRAVTGLIIPEDEDPGAVAAGVVDYIDFLLGAFTVDPPRIYAAGPFSGRHGGAKGFEVYLPLSRVKEIAWRSVIEGSRGIPEREFNGPVKGLQEIYRAGVEDLDARSQRQYGSDFADLSPPQQNEIFAEADEEFRATVFDHTVEGMYAAPEYGGNADAVGWRYIHFEGDRQPVGYARKQVEKPDAEPFASARRSKEPTPPGRAGTRMGGRGERGMG